MNPSVVTRLWESRRETHGTGRSLEIGGWPSFHANDQILNDGVERKDGNLTGGGGGHRNGGQTDSLIFNGTPRGGRTKGYE